MSSSGIVAIAVVYTFVCGALAGYIAAYRRGNGIPFFFLGIFLGFLGVIVALVVPGKPRTPKGWQRSGVHAATPSRTLSVGNRDSPAGNVVTKSRSSGPDPVR